MTPRPVPLPRAFLTRPIAHRGYHDREQGRPENSRAAFRAAIDAGYGIELDIQPAADGTPMVFHDYALERLTGQTGPVAMQEAAALGAMTLIGGDEGVPTLAEVLTLVAGRVPLLIEIKDQDGALGPNVGFLERAVAKALDGYDGAVALMSFNPHSVAALAEAAPHLPRGLVTCDFSAEDWPTVPAARRDELRPIPDIARTGASFVSHDRADLTSAQLAALDKDLPILCWTVRSPAQEAEARKVAQNITFEGYAA